jgi:preprotein translocase subunit SecG
VLLKRRKDEEFDVFRSTSEYPAGRAGMQECMAYGMRLAVAPRELIAFRLALCAVQLGTAVAVLCITAIRLQEISSWGQVSSIWNSSRQVCYMGPNVASATLCRYTYAVGAISILLTICIGLLQVGAGLCGTSPPPAAAMHAATQGSAPHGPCASHPAAVQQFSTLCNGSGGMMVL